MPKKLAVLSGPDEGRAFTLGSDPLLLGRSRATETHLLDPHVSRVHCQIQADGEAFVLLDFDSAGGTFVNGKRVSRHTLQPGDIVRIGDTRLQFVVEEAEGAQAKTPAQRVPPKPSVPAAPPVAAPAFVPRDSTWVQALVGQKLGHYKVGSALARGHAGYVFHGRDTRRNMPVALKVLDPTFSQSDAAVQRFVAAMKSVLPLRHPHLIKVYGAGKTGPHCWIAMEYVRGESLAAVIGRIKGGDMLDWRHVLRMGIYLGRALDYAHHKKVVHQNVTPANILVGKTMAETKLMDLMVAAAVADDPTVPVSAAGLPSEALSYMPPERISGPGTAVDARADIYSLGATLYAMFTGRPPFQADTVRELTDKIRHAAPVSLKSQQLGLPEPLEHINEKMLVKRPEDRYQSAKELVKQLEAFAKAHNLQI
jgi:serine/threonine protein kinase